MFVVIQLCLALLLTPNAKSEGFAMEPTACTANSLDPAKLESELKLSGKTHRSLIQESKLAAESVRIQDRLFREFRAAFASICALEKDLGNGLVNEITQTNQSSRDCPLELALANVYYRHFLSTEEKKKQISRTLFNLGSTDLKGNESTRNLLLDRQNKMPSEFSAIKMEREKLWNSSMGGYTSQPKERASSRPFFSKLNDFLQNSEQRLIQFQESMREKALFHAQRHQSCGGLKK